jgi:hypothetical protein
MIGRRVVVPALSAACAVLGLLAAPPASAASAPSAAAATSIVCNEVVALGSTTPCDVPTAGGSARYRFSVPSADTVRFRAAVPDSNPGRTLVLSASDGTVICTKSSFPQFGCAVPAGGNYRLDVTLSSGATVYTTIDTVLTATCDPPLDVSVGNTGSTVHIADPGGSWCAGFDVASGEGLEMVLDVNTDQDLTVQVYDNVGALVCELSQISAFARAGCRLTGDGSRLFASPYDDAAQDMVLIVTQVSHPTGCTSRPLDPFGVAASRRGSLGPHQQSCYRFAGSAGDGVGAHLFAVSGPTGTLSWLLRDDDGIPLCSGGPADPNSRLTACTLPADGNYNLFVSMLARDPVRFVVSLVDLSSDAGCTSAGSTAWDTSGGSGSLPGTAVGCATFDGTAGHVVRASMFGDSAVAAGLVTTTSGAVVCEAVFRATCTLPRTGTYRIAVSTYVRTSVAYRVWIIDTSAAAGCRVTSTDAFGAEPTRRARFTDNVAVCFAFTAPSGAAYFYRTAPATNFLNAAAQIRNPDGSYTCAASSCVVPSPGTYLYVLARASFADDPADTGSAVAGLWRLDRPTNCSSLGTSFASAPGSGDVSAPAHVDCRQFVGSPGDQVLVRTSPAFSSVGSQIFDADGGPVCFAVANTCTLTGAGPYRMLTYQGNLEGSTYQIKVASLTRAAGCTSLAQTPFDRAPTRAFDIQDGVDLRCYRITTSVPSHGMLGVRMVGVSPTAFHPAVTVYGAGASGLCSVTTEFGACAVLGPGEYLLVASGFDAASGTLGWLDMTSNAGCRTGPDLSFGAPPARNRIVGRGALGCTTLPYVGGDRGRFAFGPTVPGANLHAMLLSQYGQSTCDFRSRDLLTANCRIPASESGPVRLVVYADEQSSAFTGTYRMHAWRLNNPMGCTDIGSLRTGFGPLVGELADRNDEACYLAQARQGTLAVTTANDDVPADVPYAQLVRTSGLLQCGVQGSGSCGLESGTYALLVLRGPQDADFAGHYRVQGTCAVGKCGP